jgi:hypothetical protein
MNITDQTINDIKVHSEFLEIPNILNKFLNLQVMYNDSKSSWIWFIDPTTHKKVKRKVRKKQIFEDDEEYILLGEYLYIKHNGKIMKLRGSS